MAKRTRVVIGVVVGALVFGCEAQEPSSPDHAQGTSQPDLGVATGQLSIRLPGAGEGVTGFLFELKSAAHQEVEPKFVPLEDEYLDTSLVDVGGLGPRHRFADALFVLPPDTYFVKATPMASEMEPAPGCKPAFGHAMVGASTTTEIVLVASCATPQNGALDVVAVLNHGPQIVDLDLDSSKFGVLCETLTATVTAVDEDQDELTYAWKVVNAPDSADYTSTSEGPVFTFRARTAGNYEIKVAACDSAPRPLCSYLTFPLHITAQESQCEREPVTLYRMVLECKQGASNGEVQVIDLRDGYQNYTCANRYQEQCVEDGTFDAYYMEWCDYEEPRCREGLDGTISCDSGASPAGACTPKTLYRSVFGCNGTAMGGEQVIDLTGGYSNVTCGNRFKEQCVDDGSWDSYYVERCDYTCAM